jgi:hypothetical protein
MCQKTYLNTLKDFSTTVDPGVCLLLLLFVSWCGGGECAVEIMNVNGRSDETDALREGDWWMSTTKYNDVEGNGEWVEWEECGGVKESRGNECSSPFACLCAPP